LDDHAAIFFKTAETIERDSPALEEKVGKASPHWMRHTHATHALARGAELTTVHASITHSAVPGPHNAAPIGLPFTPRDESFKGALMKEQRHSATAMTAIRNARDSDLRSK
jgi:hypothetical protein